jgi:hypothetical protein
MAPSIGQTDHAPAKKNLRLRAADSLMVHSIREFSLIAEVNA